MKKRTFDKMRSLGRGMIEIVTADGYQAIISADEIESVRGRRELGTAVHTRNGRRPILLDTPIKESIAIWREAINATS